MRSLRFAPIAVLAALSLVSCNRDPNVAKKRYLESGNKYFEKGKYKEARIMYRDARQKDARYGPAYYRLGLVDEKLSLWSEAVQSFRRAIELLPPDQPDHWDSVVKLSELYIGFSRDASLLNEVEGYCAQLLKRDPNSFDGHRLTGDLDFARAGQSFNTARGEDGRRLLLAALEEYRKADAAKPGNQGVMTQISRTLAATGDFAGAEQSYRKVFESDQHYLPGYNEFYNLLVAEKKFAEAEEVLKLAYRNNPTQYGLLSRLALHYFTQNRKQDMLGVLDQIKAHASDYARAYVDVGDFYYRLGDGDSAIREYRQGIERDSKAKPTYQKRIIEVLMKQNKTAEAAALNSEILKASPNDPDARGLAATFLLNKGEVSKAMVELESVISRDPKNPVPHYNLGRAHAARNEQELARQEFQKAVDLRPDYVTARTALAQLQVSQGQYDAALKGATEILAIDKSNANARLIQATALIGLKKLPEARELLNDFLKTNPNSPDALFQRGAADLMESKFKDAEADFHRCYELNPANIRGLQGMVEGYLAQNQPDRAMSLLQGESAKAPNRLDILEALGNAAARTNQPDLAVSYFQKVLGALDQNGKQRGPIYMKIGEVYRRKGDLANAAAMLQKAHDTIPENAAVLTELAMVLDASGRWNEARQSYESAVKLDSNNGAALNNLAFLLAEHGGDLNDALTKAQRAKQLLPNMAEVSDTLGVIYLRKNLADNAIDIFQGLVTKAPTNALFRYHLGMGFYQKGDKPRALKELQDALKYNPDKSDREKIQALIAKLG
jgi:tetratricopeptide (TPR) repeat protein